MSSANLDEKTASAVTLLQQIINMQNQVGGKWLFCLGFGGLSFLLLLFLLGLNLHLAQMEFSINCFACSGREVAECELCFQFHSAFIDKTLAALITGVCVQDIAGI